MYNESFSVNIGFQSFSLAAAMESEACLSRRFIPEWEIHTDYGDIKIWSCGAEPGKDWTVISMVVNPQVHFSRKHLLPSYGECGQNSPAGRLLGSVSPPQGQLPSGHLSSPFTCFLPFTGNITCNSFLISVKYLLSDNSRQESLFLKTWKF